MTTPAAMDPARTAEDGHPAAAPEASGSARLLTLVIAGQEFGIDLDTVAVIAPLPQLMPALMGMPVLDGLARVGEELVAVVDIRRRLGLPLARRAAGPDARLVAVRHGEGLVGMAVDALGETHTLPRGAGWDAAPVLAAIESNYIAGVGKLPDRQLPILDPLKLLTPAERAALLALAPRQ